MGMAVWFGKQTSDYIPEGVPGLWERNDQYGHVFKYTLVVGSWHWIFGYNVYAMLDGTFRSAPVFTVKVMK